MIEINNLYHVYIFFKNEKIQFTRSYYQHVQQFQVTGI